MAPVPTAMSVRSFGLDDIGEVKEGTDTAGVQRRY
jgi:hypothetical protein